MARDCRECMHAVVPLGHVVLRGRGDGKKIALRLSRDDYNVGPVRCRKGEWGFRSRGHERVFASVKYFLSEPRTSRAESCEFFDRDDLLEIAEANASESANGEKRESAA